MPNPVISLLLDSGAYSAYTKNDPIDIVKYGQFVIDNQQHIYRAVNLDVLIPSDTNKAAELSLVNFKRLKDMGAVTMPVFHLGEPVKYLNEMLAETDYIGLSASMGSKTESENWCNLMYDYASDMNGYPIAKFHAFGNTAPQALLNYPWFSADSSSWVISAGMGRMLINGQALLFRANSASAPQILETDTGVKRETWEAIFVAANLDPDKCINMEMRESDKMLIRFYMNAVHFLKVQEATRGMTKYTGPSSILNEKYFKDGGMVLNDPMKLHFVLNHSNASRAMGALTLLGARNILVSHYYNNPKFWNDHLVPWMYDPIALAFSIPKFIKEVEFLQGLQIKPKSLDELRAQYI